VQVCLSIEESFLGGHASNFPSQVSDVSTYEDVKEYCYNLQCIVMYLLNLLLTKTSLIYTGEKTVQDDT